jgi:hypothetical protein
MSNWLITEHSDKRLVTQVTSPPSFWTSTAFKVVMGFITYMPGCVALLIGFSSLPKTSYCNVSQISSNSMECQEVKKFLDIPINTNTIQLVGQKFQPSSHNIPGNNSFFGLGLLWLGGVSAGFLINKSLNPQKITWIFDRTSKIVQQHPETILDKTVRTFAKSDIHGLVLEIPDLANNSAQVNIFVRLNMDIGEIPTQYLSWNENQPAVYTAPYSEFSKVVESVIKPICQILDIPWQLKFFHQDECFIFDFAERLVDRYLNGEKLLRVEFTEITSLEMEGPFVEIITDPDNAAANINREAAHYLNLVLTNGEKLRIHQFTNIDAIDNNTAQEWLSQLQFRLNEIVQTAVLV